MRKTAAILTAFCSSVVIATFLALGRQSLSPAIAWVSLGLGVLTGVAVHRQGRDSLDVDKLETPGILGWFTITVGLLFSLRAFCWLVYFDEDKVKILSPNNLGDLALHLGYINHLASGARFWPDEPLYSGEQLHYPIGVDLFNSLLTLCGANTYTGLVWVGLAACLLCGFALYRWGGAFALAGFLFNGGVAGFAIFRTHAFADFQSELAWKSFPLAMLVTQRGFLYALPAGLLLLIHWREKYIQAGHAKAQCLLPTWVEVLLYSTMPLFHLHTFLFLSMLLACWLIAGSIALRLEVARLLAYSLAPATVAVSLVTGLFQSHPHAAQPSIVRAPGLGGFFDFQFAKLGIPFHIKAGWMQEDQNFRDFWFGNFGLLPVFILALVCVLVIGFRSSREDRTALAFVFPAVLIFGFCCFVMLAPWEWDNTKVMIWCYLAVLPFLWSRLIVRFPVPIRLAALFAIFFSGFVTLIGGIDGSHQGLDFARRSELDGVSQALKPIPLSATFAAYPTYNHPLVLLGRKMAMGYSGHLWSHGIDYRLRETELASLMNGEANWRNLSKKLGTRYLFWGEREEEAFGESRKPWQRECLAVARGEWGDIYDLDSPAASSLLRGPQLNLLPENEPEEKLPLPNKALKRMPLPERSESE